LAAGNQPATEARTWTCHLFRVLSLSIICPPICPNSFTAGHRGASAGRLNRSLVPKSAVFAGITTVLSPVSAIIYNSSATRQNHGGMTCNAAYTRPAAVPASSLRCLFAPLYSGAASALTAYK
jgi:hypothetical protein